MKQKNHLQELSEELKKVQKQLYKILDNISGKRNQKHYPVEVINKIIVLISEVEVLSMIYMPPKKLPVSSKLEEELFVEDKLSKKL